MAGQSSTWERSLHINRNQRSLVDAIPSQGQMPWRPIHQAQSHQTPSSHAHENWIFDTNRILPFQAPRSTDQKYHNDISTIIKLDHPFQKTDTRTHTYARIPSQPSEYTKNERSLGTHSQTQPLTTSHWQTRMQYTVVALHNVHLCISWSSAANCEKGN